MIIIMTSCSTWKRRGQLSAVANQAPSAAGQAARTVSSWTPGVMVMVVGMGLGMGTGMMMSKMVR